MQISNTNLVCLISNTRCISASSPNFFCQSDVLFGQPGLDVNAGIGTGNSALAVAAMVGNDWAIARYIN